MWLFVLLLPLLLSLVIADRTGYAANYKLQPSASYKGVAYSAFLHEGPEPEGHHEPLRPENIERDMQLLQKLNVRWIRTYATDLNGSLIPSIAKKYGIDTFVGTWVNAGDEGVDFWHEELARAEEIFKKDNTLAPIIVVGNELAYTKKQPMSTVIKMVQEAHDKGFYVALGDIPPSYLDPAYAPLWQAADILLLHSHPYFSHIRTTMNVRVMGTRLMPDAAAADDVIQATLKIMELFPDKLVVIGESGYPSEDDSPVLSPAKCRWCSTDNQRHFIETLLWMANQNKLGIFAFEAFDEHWKGEVGEEAGSGPHWGFFDADRNPKPAAEVVGRWAAAGPDFPPPARSCEYIASQSECRPKESLDEDSLNNMLSFACNEGTVDCEELEKNSLLSVCPLRAKVSWAITKYFQQNLWRDSACDFNGSAAPNFAEGALDSIRTTNTLRYQAVPYAPVEFVGNLNTVNTGTQHSKEAHAKPLLPLLLVLLLVSIAAWEARTGRLVAFLQHVRHRQYLEV